jgi:DNA-binding SARP family transcriptional activator/tetratricopeptide (TPR) repeat protein
MTLTAVRQTRAVVDGSGRAAERVEITLLGRFEVTVDGVDVPARGWARRQAATLVKVLALSPHHRLHREQVVDLMWPDDALDLAAPKLHKAAHFTRRATDHADAIVLRDETVHLFPDADVVVDAVTFEQLAQQAIVSRDVDIARRALQLYGGELCPQDRYEEWSAARREALRLHHVDLLRLTGRWDQLVELDPSDEQAHLELMRRQAGAGDGHAALRQFERLDRALRRELGLAPGAEAIALRDRLLAEIGPATRTATLLIGRDAEVATVEQLLRDAGAGRARTMIVTGPAGIGKSALLKEARTVADGRGWRVGHGTAAPVEGMWPFAPVMESLADVCRRHPTLLDGLADVYREEIDRVLGGADATWTGQSGYQRLFVAATELVRLAAGSDGLLLTIDDVHAADDASLRLLHYLARATPDQRVAIIIAHRPHPISRTLAELRDSLTSRHGADQLVLAPLDLDATRTLICRHHGSSDEEALGRITALAGGIPFAIEVLARRAATTPGWSQTLDDSMITGVSSSTRDVLQRVAVAGATFDTDEFVALSGLAAGEAYEHLDAAVVAGLVESDPAGYRFRHTLVRDALLEGLPPHRRRRIHHDAAERLAELSAPPARIGFHLLAAGEPARAVPEMLRAAETAAAVGAYRDALDLVEAVRTHASGKGRVRLLTLRADLLMAIGDQSATAAYREALGVTTGDSRRTLRARLARAATMSGDLPTAAAALDGLELDGGPADTEILLALGNVAYFSGDHDSAWRVAEQARQRVLQGEKSWQVLDLIGLQGMLAHQRGEWFDRLTVELRRTRDVPDVASALFDGYLCPAEYMLYGATPYGEVIELCRSLRATAERAGALRAVAFATSVIGEAAYLSGDLDLAGRELQQSIELHHEIAATTGESAALQRLAEVQIARGDVDEANHLLRRAFTLARWSALARHLIQRIYGTMISAAPSTAAACAVVDRAETALGTDDNCPFCDVMLAVPATIACADGGDLSNARRHLQTAQRSAQLWEGSAWEAAVAEARAHVAAAAGDLDDARHEITTAADAFTAAGQPLDAVRCRRQAARW